jgi:hypothetical protein
MTFADIETLTATIRGYYPDFGFLPPAMVRLWAEGLQQADVVTCSKALARWARQHTAKAPSLDELAEQVEFVREGERLPRPARPAVGSTAWLATMGDRAEQQQVVNEKTGEILRDQEDVQFGHLMTKVALWTLAEWEDTKGEIRPQLTAEDRAQLCESWAMAYQYEHPALAEDLRQVAKHYRQARAQERL